jgi:Ni2+-binding GTPase involved in maturation of urease and hydrogenase
VTGAFHLVHNPAVVPAGFDGDGGMRRQSRQVLTKYQAIVRNTERLACTTLLIYSDENSIDARMIERGLADWDISFLDLLIIENVGNLVCPASYDQ